MSAELSCRRAALTRSRRSSDRLGIKYGMFHQPTCVSRVTASHTPSRYPQRWKISRQTEPSLLGDIERTKTAF
ncbi:unnamed protein product [Pleuronectes platessa]|uniref:Uncharacterized protein n=1 Tax=Pleuronectes platessa TaxID=8262 RepID=A0A9N7TIB9_PLEPL|nr:unnamed protein product [Pleuronectes platessa]